MTMTVLICICLAGGCFLAAITSAAGFLIAAMAEGYAGAGSKWATVWDRMQVLFVSLLIVFLFATALAAVPALCLQYELDRVSKSAE